VDLVVLVGLQGSGKTTFFGARFGATHALVSKDLIRNARDRNRRQEELVRAAAAAGRSVVVDNTNVRREDRTGLVALARALGMRPVCYVFPADVTSSLARNMEREGKARVPAVAIHATARRLVPPGPEEGFDEIYQVRPAPGAFEIRRLA
jgi:predicted kinase